MSHVKANMPLKIEMEERAHAAAVALLIASLNPGLLLADPPLPGEGNASP